MEITDTPAATIAAGAAGPLRLAVGGTVLRN